MTVAKAEIPAPTLPRETATVAGVGEVTVRGLLLSERLSFIDADDNDNDYSHVPRSLSLCVLDRDDQPVWSAAAWDVWGATHLREVLELYAVIKRLSGIDAEVNAKN